jgi:hypothetical protein
MRRLRVWWHCEFVECGPDEDVAGDEINPGPGKIAAPGWDACLETLGLLSPVKKVDIEDVREAAKEYADYFYSDRDGHENSWPQDFVVLDRRDGTYHVVSVDIDWSPSFHSSFPKPYVPLALRDATVRARQTLNDAIDTATNDHKEKQ